MDRNDQAAIEDLFAKIEVVARNSPPRDSGADSFIRDRLSRQPNAPYYMAQTIVVQDQALERAEARIEELEQQLRSAPPRGGSVPRVGRAGEPAQPPYAQQAGGGFLAGAMQTALGVAGGVLLGNAIGGLFGSQEAKASDSTAQADASDDNDNADDQDDDGDFGGDDFGGDGFDGGFDA